MKIAYISSSTIPSRSANSIHVMKMCQALAKLEHEVSLYCYNKGRSNESCSVSDYEYYGVANSFRIRKLFSFPCRVRNVFYSILVFFFLYKQKPEIIYSRNLLATLFASLLNVPIMYEAHDAVNNRISKTIINYLATKKNFINFVVITEYLKKQYELLVPNLKEKILVASDAADCVPNNVKSTKVRGDSKVFKVGYVGSFYKGKGVEIICEVAKICPEVSFHLVGGDLEDVKALGFSIDLPDNVFLYGRVPHSQIYSYILSMDALLLPNQKVVECFGGGGNIGSCTSPLKMFEYMATKKPIIASNLPVLEEVLLDKENALLCECDNPADWAKTIRFLKDNPEESKRIALNGYRDFIEKYTWDARVKKILISY